MAFDSPDSFFGQIGRNRIIWATFLAWFTAQALKVLIGYFREKRFNFKWLFRSGGMPSSHSALSMCLTTSIGLYYGFDSGLFAVSLGFTVVTMFDAQGVRRHSGRQAIILNKILDDIYAHRGVQEARLKELVGHTQVEVYAGALLGIVTALLCYSRG
jgi:acid phosphatase family membrane protein YuiD